MSLKEKCLDSKYHMPLKGSIISNGFDAVEYTATCSKCEQNISQISWYDDDCGWRESNWAIA